MTLRLPYADEAWPDTDLYGVDGSVIVVSAECRTILVPGCFNRDAPAQGKPSRWRAPPI